MGLSRAQAAGEILPSGQARITLGTVMLRAMVLCAGLGTRLRPLTDELPKPLVPVGDRPLLAHILERLASAGVERAVMNVHHKPEEMLRSFDVLPFMPQVITEVEILGTAG